MTENYQPHATDGPGSASSETPSNDAHRHHRWHWECGVELAARGYLARPLEVTELVNRILASGIEHCYAMSVHDLTAVVLETETFGRPVPHISSRLAGMAAGTGLSPAAVIRLHLMASPGQSPDTMGRSEQ